MQRCVATVVNCRKAENDAQTHCVFCSKTCEPIAHWKASSIAIATIIIDSAGFCVCFFICDAGAPFQMLGDWSAPCSVPSDWDRNIDVYTGWRQAFVWCWQQLPKWYFLLRYHTRPTRRSFRINPSLTFIVSHIFVEISFGCTKYGHMQHIFCGIFARRRP